MPYRMIRDGEYLGTGLPVFRVYDADEYNDVTRTPRAIGEVWGVGVRGITRQYVPTGVRWQITGDYSESELFPVGAYADAARAMIKAYDGTESAT